MLNDLSERMIRKHVTNGVLPPLKDGFLPVVDTIRAYTAYIKENPPGRPTSEKNVEQLAVVRERHRKLKIENDVATNNLIEREEVAHVFREAATILSNSLDGAAGRMSSGDAVLRQRLLNEHRRIRENFAAQLQNFIDSSGGGGHSAPAADPHSSGMGGTEQGDPEGVS